MTRGTHCLLLPFGGVRLATMDRHCLLVFATLTPIPVWVRIATMGTYCLFVLMTFSLLPV